MSAPDPRPSLTDKVYQHLKAQLANRQRRVGDRLHARHVATELEVSRTTVNKAIERLIAEGLVRIDDDRHTVVASLPAMSLRVVDAPEFEFLNQTDGAYEVFLEKILRGDFGPGEIVKERPLAIELGVNPATLRRAAEWLRGDGLLERLPRRGWRVTLLSPRDIHDAYDLRLLLEPKIVAEATHRISEDILDQLEEDTERLITLGEKATVFDRREADSRFHQTLSQASSNRIVADALEPIIRKLLLVTTVRFRYGRAARSFEEHKVIVAALRKRDEKQAIKGMKDHLRNAKKFNSQSLFGTTING